MDIDIDKSLNESTAFSNSVEATKYYRDKDTDWEDVANRFKDTVDTKTYDLIKNKKFLAAGSILFGFNNNEVLSSLSNCYYVPIEDDSIEKIGQAMTNNMKTFSWRGGVGNSFEVLRPKNSPVSNAAKSSSGSVSFMPLFAKITETIGSHGRRAASIFTHHINHPDSIDFIKSKSDPKSVFPIDPLNPDKVVDISGANISIKLTDKFMNAVKNDEFWDFTFPDFKYDRDLYDKEWTGDYKHWADVGGKLTVYKKISAGRVFSQIVESSWKYAEPGVLFWDTIENNTPMSCIPEMKVTGVNPCSEQILGDYQSCLLSSHVLYKYVVNKWQKDAYFDFESFKESIKLSVTFMNQMIDKNTHPLQKQIDVEKRGRKIGIGFTGMADALAMLGFKYGTKDFLETLEKILVCKAYYETYYSIIIAKEEGCCAVLENNELRKEYAYQPYFSAVSESFKVIFDNKASDLGDLIAMDGIRNIATSTVAPNGTLSIIAGNCTSGIEPLFMLNYFRKSRIYDGEVNIIHPILLEYIKVNAPDDIKLTKQELLDKYNYIEAQDINYKTRIKVQALIQKYTTDSISSTVNLPSSTTKKQVSELYIYAWENKLKGITIYRDGCSLAGLLTSKKDEDMLIKDRKLKLNSEEYGKRYIIRWKNLKIYVNLVIRDGLPIEIYANLPYSAGLPKGSDTFDQTLFLERLSYWNAITRLLSLAFCYSTPMEEILKCLKKSSYSVSHLPAGLYRILSKFYSQNNIQEDTGNLAVCPNCKQNRLKKDGSCNICLNCGYSKCA